MNGLLPAAGVPAAGLRVVAGWAIGAARGGGGMHLEAIEESGAGREQSKPGIEDFLEHRPVPTPKNQSPRGEAQ